MDRGWLRAVATVAGTVTNGTTEEATWFNVAAETARLTKEVQAWQDVGEAASHAEHELIEIYRRDGGYYDLKMDAHGFATAAREAIARQIAHRFGLWAASKASASEARSLEQSEAVDRTARRMIARFTHRAYF